MAPSPCVNLRLRMKNDADLGARATESTRLAHCMSVVYALRTA